MIQFTVPIYYKDYVPRAKKNALIGLNWYAGASNVIRGRGGNSTTVASMTKVKFNEMFASYADQLKEQAPHKFNEHGAGYHVQYDIYLGRDGCDGHNVRSVIEKFALDALEDNGIIDNDRYVYSTATKVYLDRGNPRAEITVSKLESHEYEIN